MTDEGKERANDGEVKKNPQSVLGDDRRDFDTIPIMKRGQRREERWESERGAVLDDADDELGVPTGRSTRGGG